MAKVNPPPVPKIPVAWLQDPETRAFIIELNNIVYQLWERTGGFNDDVADTGIRENYPFETNFDDDESGQNYYQSSTQDHAKEFNAVTKEQDYTAVAYDFINAKRSAIITLPSPDENDVVIVRNGDGSKITIKSSKNINGHSSVISRVAGTALVFHYFIDSDEWLIR